MNSLRSRKQLLVAEATVQRQLLGADVERLVQQASGWKRRCLSARAVASAGFSAVSFIALLRGRSGGGKTSLFTRLFGWARAGWTLWNAVQPMMGRTAPAPRPGPSAASGDAVAEALEALRRAEEAARNRR